MNENWQVIVWTIQVFFVLMASMLYSFGGRPGGRLLKRLAAPLLLIAPILIINYYQGHWNNWYLLSFGYINWPWIGYGGKTLFTKWWRRSLWSLLYCSAALVFVIHSHAWIIFGIQSGISLMCSTAFGVYNPFRNNAPAEEGSIWFASNFLLPFML